MRKAHFSHGVTAGAEAFAMTRGTAVALEMTVGTVVMIQADKAEELVVTATAMVVMMLKDSDGFNDNRGFAGNCKDGEVSPRRSSIVSQRR